METCYQNEGFRQYIVLKGEDQDVDDFQLNMLMRYEGAGLLPLEIQGCDGRFQIAYDIKGTQTLSQMTEGQELDYPILRQLFVDLWKCYKEMEEYLLPPEGIRIAQEMIYYDNEKKQFRFCFHLGGQEELESSLIMLVEFCMKHTRHQDAKAVMYIYGLYRLLQAENAGAEEVQCFLEDMEKQMGIAVEEMRTEIPHEMPKLEEQDKEKQHPEKQHSAKQHSEICNCKKRESQGQRIKPKVWVYGILAGLSLIATIIYALRYWVFLGYDRDCKFMIFSMVLFGFFLYSTVMLRRRQNKETIPQEIEVQEKETCRQIIENAGQSSGETDVIGRTCDGETCLIQHGKQNGWWLKGVDTPDIFLHIFPGILGRSEQVAYPIHETGISRKHARVFEQQGELYIEDLGSTNGTYYNGRRLSEREPVLLQEGARLVLGANHYMIEKEKNHWEKYD